MKNYLFLSASLAFLFLNPFVSCDRDEENVLALSDSVAKEEPLPKPVREVTPCINGKAGAFDCNGIDLIAQVSIADLGGNGNGISGNDCWGWTDPDTEKEYALIGISNGTAFVDISTPDQPVVKGLLPTATENSDWRDIKVYGNHAFIVSEARGHGLQVFDLTRLRNEDIEQTFTADLRLTDFGNAHNIVINEYKGFAYVTGTNRRDTYNGGVTIIDVREPKAAKVVGGHGADRYSHDGQVVTYCGPDKEHTDKEIFIGSNENQVVIVDVTDPTNTMRIASIRYDNIEYTHQGWFTDDQRYFLLGDELDEQKIGLNTRTVVFDFTDLDNPVVHQEYFGGSKAIDHNGYVKEDTFYLANYSAGVRLIDISDLENKNMEEVAFFDTYTRSDATNFNGVWNVYPYFKSGYMIASDVQQGLFILKEK